MRRDLLAWLLLGDIASVATPTLLHALVNPTGALMTASTGAAMLLLAWSLGALRVDVVDQARSGWGRLLTAAAVIAPIAIIAKQALAPLSSTISVLLLLLAAQTTLAIINRSIESAWLRRCRMDGHGLRRTLIVMGTGAEVILRQLHRHPGDGFLVVGYLSATTSRPPPPPPPRHPPPKQPPHQHPQILRLRLRPLPQHHQRVTLHRELHAKHPFPEKQFFTHEKNLRSPYPHPPHRHPTTTF